MSLKKICGAAAPALFGTLIFAAFGFGQESKPASPTQPASAKANGDAVVTGLAAIEPLIGVWEVSERHFDPLGNVVGTAKGSEDNDWILEKHAIRRSYVTSTSASAYRAAGSLTWNPLLKRFDGYWMDNTSMTGPTLVEAEWEASTKTLASTFKRLTQSGVTTTYKVVDKFEDNDKRTSTTFQLDGKQTTKLMEVEYRRSARCPSRTAGMRIMMDELKEGQK